MSLFKMFRHPTYEDTVTENLRQAKLNLLAAEAQLEMAHAHVVMCRSAVSRLEKNMAAMVEEGV